jgi:hypothetical protein
VAFSPAVNDGGPAGQNESVTKAAAEQVMPATEEPAPTEEPLGEQAEAEESTTDGDVDASAEEGKAEEAATEEPNTAENPVFSSTVNRYGNHPCSC